MAELTNSDLLEALEAKLADNDEPDEDTRQKRQRPSGGGSDGNSDAGGEEEGNELDVSDLAAPPGSRGGSRGGRRKKSKKGSKRPSSKRVQRDEGDSEDDEDDEDDEEGEDDLDDEDDDGDEPGSGRRNRHRRVDRSVTQFFDDAADEDEDDGSHRHKTAEERILQQEERIRAVRAEEDAKRKRLAEQRSAEEIAADITERAKASRYIETAAEEEDAAQAKGRGTGPGLLSQTDLPTLRDPRLFLLHCKENREQEIVIAICNKFIESEGHGLKLAILSAMTTSKGIIYVEAYREAHVRAALAGIPDVYAWRPGAIKMMRPEDAPTALTVKTKASQLVRHGWVRMTRGDYKGDLAKVRDLLDNGAKVLIQAVPRINFQKLGMTKEQRQSLKSRGARPAQRLYNRAEVVAAVSAAGGSTHPETRMTRFGMRCDYFQGSYYNEGFLFRECPSSHVTIEGAPPTVEELRKFRPRRNADADGLEDEDPVLLAETQQQKEKEWQASLSMDLGKAGSSSAGASTAVSAMEAKIANGDAVVVAHGDLQGIEGRVVSIDESTNSLMIRPEAEIARELGMSELRLLIRDVMKTFDVGTRVKVVGGMHSGQTGMVIVTQPTESGDHSAVLTLDAGNKRVEVLVKHLRETREIVTAVGDLQGFKLYDQVELPSAAGQMNESGCVVGMGVADLIVMDSSGKVERRPPSQVRHKRNPRGQASTAIDSTYQAVRVGDVVKVTEGTRKGMDGVVKHTAGGILFLYSIKETNNSGMFVERSTSTVLAGAGSRGSGSAAAAAAALGISGAAAVAPAGMGGVSGMAKTTGLMLSGGGGGGGRGRGRGRGVNDPDRLLNAPVRVMKGTYKRMLGVVRQLQGESVQVELHSGQRKVTVPKSFVRKESQAPGGHGGAGGRMTIEQLRAMAKANKRKAGAAAATASYGTGAYGRTAQYGTASYGTAAYTQTGQYGTAANATPRYGGGATPGGGSATPAYGGGSATPAYGGGSATPAYGGGSATPAYGDGHATSSSMWQAATPGPSGADEDELASGGALPALCTRGAMVQVTTGPSAGQSGVVEEAATAQAVQVTLADGQAVTLPASSLQAQLPSNNSLVMRVGDGAEGYVQGDVTTTDTSEEVPVRFSSGAVEMQRLADLVALQR